MSASTVAVNLFLRFQRMLRLVECMTQCNFNVNDIFLFISPTIDLYFSALPVVTAYSRSFGREIERIRRFSSVLFFAFATLPNTLVCHRRALKT